MDTDLFDRSFPSSVSQPDIHSHGFYSSSPFFFSDQLSPAIEFTIYVTWHSEGFEGLQSLRESSLSASYDATISDSSRDSDSISLSGTSTTYGSSSLSESLSPSSGFQDSIHFRGSNQFLSSFRWSRTELIFPSQLVSRTVPFLDSISFPVSQLFNEFPFSRSDPFTVSLRVSPRQTLRPSAGSSQSSSVIIGVTVGVLFSSSALFSVLFPGMAGALTNRMTSQRKKLR
jgi:hypothetical protein